MKSYCLASSSAGNCFVFDFEIKGEHTRLMVECGIPLEKTFHNLNNIDIKLSSIDACLITHAHSDHSKSARKLVQMGIPIFASKGTLEKLKLKGNELILGEPNRVANGLFVMPFEVEHDIDGAVGFVIKTKDECVIFVIDHKRWTVDLGNFKPDYVFIECNYDNAVVYSQLRILKRQSKTITDEIELHDVNVQIAQHERNINTHCSLNGTIKGLEKLNLSKCQAIFLTHLSDRYANEYKMKNTVQEKIGIKTYVCKKDGGIK